MKAAAAVGAPPGDCACALQLSCARAAAAAHMARAALCLLSASPHCVQTAGARQGCREESLSLRGERGKKKHLIVYL